MKETRFFFELGEARQQCFLSELINNEGKVIIDFVPLIEHVFDFYSELYRSEGTDESDINYVLDHGETKLGDSDIHM